MRKFIFSVIFILISLTSNASNDSLPFKMITQNKLMLGLETNIKFLASDMNINKQGLDFGINLNYYLTNILYIGGFYNQYNDVWNTSNSTFLLNQRLVNLSTGNFNNFGFLAGYRMAENKNFVITPELKLGYGSLAFKSINSEKIETADMITIEPKVYAGYKLNKSSVIGLSTSYFIPFYLDRFALDEYNLQHASIGVFFKTALVKTQKKHYVNQALSSDQSLVRNLTLHDIAKAASTTSTSTETPESSNAINSDVKSTEVKSTEVENTGMSFTEEKTVEDNDEISFGSPSKSNNAPTKISNSRNVASKPSTESKINIDNSDNSETSTDFSSTMPAKTNSGNLTTYTIVVASFSNQKNAIKFVNNSKSNSNRKLNILYDADINRYRIAFMVNSTKEKIIEIRDNTRSEYPGSWIIDFKN